MFKIDIAEITGPAGEQGGALDPEQVYVQFICNTGEDAVEHDPDTPPDSRVRPAHAALHGRVFRLDEGAPIPPLDYGCRCGIRYVSKPGTVADRLLDEQAPSLPVTVPEAYESWLSVNAPEWEAVARAAQGQRFPLLAAEAKAKALGYGKDVARMALTIRPATPAQLPPAPPLKP